MPNYTFNGTPWSEADVIKRAEEKGQKLEEYLKENPQIKVEVDSLENISSELPQVTMKDVDQRESKAVELLNKKFGGLGFSFRQNEIFGTDGVIITAPNKADGTPGTEQRFQTDLDVLGFSTYTDQLWGTSSKTEAKAINDFIKANVNSEVVNEETYNQTWNYANSRKISATNKDGTTKKLGELNSEELQLEIDDTYVELMYGSKKLPGADRILKEINTNLNTYAEKTVLAIKDKYDTSKKDQYDLAIKEFNTLVETEHDRLFKNSKELSSVSVGITKALNSRFGGTVSDKKRDEAEIAQLPSWVTAFDSDIIRQGYITAKIKFPKAWKEINILEHGKEMGLISNELKELNAIIAKGGSADDKYSRDQKFTFMPSLAKDIEVGTSSITSKDDGKEIETGKKGIYDSYDGTVGDRIEYLQKLNGEYNKNLALNIASQQSYQKKLENVRVPSAFGKTIDDPDLTFDEWQGMLGDQAVQMVSAALSFGGSTYIQEGGGAALEMIEIEAAMKEFPVGFQQKQIDEFFGVEEVEGKGLDLDSPPAPPSSEEWEKMTDKEKQDWEDGVVKPKAADFEQALKAFKNLPEEKRRELMLEVLENGEVNLDIAAGVGAINAGLDMVSNFVGITKAMKFAPKSLVRDILAKNVGKILKGTKGIGVATVAEGITEVGQEFTSMTGVGISTGYYGNKDKNLKRYGEAAAQALLSTGPLVGGTATIGTINSEIKANYRAMKDPNDTRNAINNAKRGFDNAYKDGEISLDERNEFFDSLEAEEDIINKYTEYKEMDVDQKETVVRENITIKGNNQLITELQAKVKKSKKESEGGISLDAIKDQIKIEDLQNENRKAQNAINKQVRIANDIKSRKRFVQHVKSNPELYKGANPMDLMTIEKAKKYFAEMGMLEDVGVKRLLAGEVNAFQAGKNVFSIQEVRHNNIKSNKGYGTSNAFHHDILHVIQEGMSIKELRAMQKEIVKQLMTSKDPKLAEIMAVAEATFAERYGSKFNKTQKNYYLEYMANLSDAMKEYTLDNLTQESGMSFGRIAEYLSGTFHSKTKIGKDWANFGPENALEHIKEYTNFYGQRQSLRVAVPKGKVQVDLPKDKVVKEKSRYSELSKSTPEQLVKIIQRGRNPQKVKEAEGALATQFELLALSEKALNYDTRKGDIAREDVVAEAMTYLPGIIKRFDPTTSKFSTFVIANMRPKRQVIYEKVKPLTYGETTSTDTKEARQVEDTSGKTTNTENVFVQKINILQDFAIANRAADKIKALVKVVKGDNFKSIISKYAGKVGGLIFEVPANKIMEGGANLAAVTKYTEGMPAPAEAQNIQRVFNAPNNAEKFIKTLPLYNVTDKTADINKIGENIEVSRDTYGYAIGLKGLPLDYFYENYTDPKALSKDPKVYEQRVTSKAGRSMGLTSQTPMKRLKPQFRKPTPETVEQFKKDLGITPKNEANVYSRDIGQLLKGVAKVHSINAAISGAQRVQEAKTKAAPVTEQKTIKQQTADITAAQGKAAFSEVVTGIVNIRSLFQLEEKGIDKLLEALDVGKTFNLKSKTEVDKFVVAVKTKLLPLMPRDFWFGKPDVNGNFGTVFTGSSKVVGTTDAAKKLYKEYYEPAMKALGKDKNQLFGDPITGVSNFSISAYSTIFKDAKTINGNTKGIKAWNKKVATIHEVMWQRFNDAIRGDKANAKVIGNYLKMVGSDTKHWHKLGAQFVGHSKKITGKRFEYEHAMPATAAYLYLMDAALSNSDFKASYAAVIKNYKLIALDKAMDGKLTSVGLQRRMPIGWDLIQNNWWDRYFNELVAGVEGGIDPGSIQGLDGKTFGEMFSVNKEGGKAFIKLGINKNKTINDAIVKARGNMYSETSRGITVLDFDDTLATTKSGVRYTLPNPSGKPAPGRKVIFMAGGAGSGKSNVINKLGLQEQGFKIVNQDISLEWLAKNSGLPTDMRDFTSEQASKWGSLQWQARDIAQRKQMKFQGRGDGIIVDGTGASSVSMGAQVMKFRNAGYDVQMMFVETSLDIALARNKARKERSLKDFIVERNHKSVMANKKGFKELFGKRFAEVNTDKLKQNDPIPKDFISKLDDFTKGYIKGRLTAEEFANKGTNILEQGAQFDFSEFNKVVEGQTAPLFEKAMKLQGKFGNKDMFVLTARPAESAQAIFEFLQANGLNIPLKNITGLGNSTAESKALWMADKVSKGYNDFYFADDAIQNVKAVDNMLEQFDVKRKVQQARVDFVKGDPQVVKLLKESSINDVKNVDRLTKPGTYNNVKFSESHRAEYEKTISKNRPDLVKDKLVSKTVDNMFDFIDNLDIPADKKRKYEKITTKWLATSNIKLNEDSYKIKDAVELAEKYNKDIFSYNNPNEIIEAYAGKAKAKPTDPSNVKEFSSSASYKKRGLTTYNVENTKEGQKAVRKVIDTHWGKDSNPWCITQVKDGKLTDDAWQNWTAYDKGPKRIIFQDGKLSSFFASDQFWDRMDNATDGPPIVVKEGRVTKKVELVEMGEGKFDEFVMETRTVSKDKRTATTEHFVDKPLDPEGYTIQPAGTKIVERRVNGQTTRETTYRPNGDLKKITNFKDGKAIQTRTLRKTVTTSINNETRLDVEKHGDRINHEIREGKTDYWFGEISMEAQGIKDAKSDHQEWIQGVAKNMFPIGFQTKAGFEVMDIMKRVDGKLRVDVKKLLEIDPDAKGLPSGTKFSESMDQKFNDILENVTGIDSKKRFSAIKARKRGDKKGKFRFFIPPSHEDFVGLLYNFMGKGKEGNAHRNFWEKALVRPLNRAYRELNTAKQSIANDYKSLNKQFEDVKKKLTKKTPDGDFTYQDAIRTYLWNKHGHKVPGLSPTDQQKLVDLVMGDPELRAYTETLNVISKQETYVKPTENWEAGDIRTDLDDATGRVGRQQFFPEFNENSEIIFSEENFNKIEAAYGASVVSAIKDILYRTKTGRNRPSGQNELTNRFMNYLNGSVASTMFVNVRSALLQQMSIVNFINFADNNVLMAAKAFANQPQYYKDWAFIFNSDFMKQRRGGIKTDVNGAELAASLKGAKNTPRALLGKLLELGFLPTQIGDNFAIATGGAPFYRNRVNTYLKQGLSQKEAELKAFIDFQKLAEETQQSARPDMVSQQQASPLGKVILAFQNVTSQFNRIGKKAFLDIKNRRITPGNTTQLQSDMSNLSRIGYYFAVQNIIFYSLQTALFAMMFDDDPDDEKLLKKQERVINGSIDSVLRGTGVMGSVVATLKNMVIKFAEQRKKGYNPDESAVILEMLNVSPPLGIKVRKLVNAEKTLNYNKKVIDDMETFDIDNPIWSATTNIIEGTTNAPLNRIYNKTINTRNALDNQYTAFQRALFISGYTTWSLDLGDTKKMKDIKEKVKGKKKKEKTWQWQPDI
jgi:hypothetical protein